MVLKMSLPSRTTRKQKTLESNKSEVRLKLLYVLGGKIRYNGTTPMPGTRVSARDAHVHRLSRCARRDCHAVYVSPDLSRWLPRDETYPEIVQGTTEVHHALPDPSFPQTDAVWDQRAHLNSSKA
jgi:hypothetical protein